MFIYVPCVFKALKPRNMVLEHLELELQTFVSHEAGTGIECEAFAKTTNDLSS